MRVVKIAANQRLDSALGRLLVVVENYPQLKSNENFLRLQDELAGTENRIAVERRRYNETLQDYNTYISLFPNKPPIPPSIGPIHQPPPPPLRPPAALCPARAIEKIIQMMKSIPQRPIGDE